MNRRGFYALLLCTLSLVATACNSGKSKDATSAPTPNKPVPEVSLKGGAFEDATAGAGIQFVYSNGRDESYRMVETTPGGCAWLDYNKDGFQDIFLLQSGYAPGSKTTGKRPPCALYRNKGDGTFEDVTEEAGIGKIDQGYAQAVAVGDYDNDGFSDIFITAYAGNHLLHNDGKGHFTDTAAVAGVSDTDKGVRWCTGATWVDYDRDGKLDLIVLRYCPWTPETDVACKNNQQKRTYCSPEMYTEGRPRLYHNEGSGKFADVTEKMGLDTSRETGTKDRIKGRLLGVLTIDYDQDGWTDLYITGDITPNLLLHNRKGKGFQELGVETNVSYGTDATLLSGMGVTAGDYSRNGCQAIVVTNFSGQPNSLYQGMPGGIFEDRTYPSGIGAASLNYLAWGVEFLDYDNDGFLDLVVGNGHVDPYIADVTQNVTYAERKLLHHNKGNGTFEEIEGDLGALREERTTRGLAVGDYKNDGRISVLDNAHNMPARLYRNVKPGGNFVTIRLEGTKSPRDGSGSLVWATSGGTRQLIEVRNTSSYASSSDIRAHFGLGKQAEADKIEVRWSSGTKQEFSHVKAGQFYSLKEGGSLIPDPLIKQKP